MHQFRRPLHQWEPPITGGSINEVGFPATEYELPHSSAGCYPFGAAFFISCSALKPLLSLMYFAIAAGFVFDAS
jgi:hypothetical protein